MDSLTHLLVGHAMGTVASGTAHPYGAAVYWAVLIGNSLPDIDVPVSLLLRRGFKLHRTTTHTLGGAAFLSLLLAAGVQVAFPGAPLPLLMGWAFAAMLVHMALDCLNLFGTRLFWPLSRHKMGLGLLHITDPLLLLLLGVPILGAALDWLPSISVHFALISVAPYILYRGATARRLSRILRRFGSSKMQVIPWFAGWRYVVETANAIEFGRWSRRGPEALVTYLKQKSPIIQSTLAHPKVAAFLKQAEYPYAVVEKKESGPEVVWSDALRQMRADFQPLRIPVEACGPYKT